MSGRSKKGNKTFISYEEPEDAVLRDSNELQSIFAHS